MHCMLHRCILPHTQFFNIFTLFSLSQTVCFNFQDYTKFLDEEFDVKEWVNNAFATNKEQGVTKDVGTSG